MVSINWALSIALPKNFRGPHQVGFVLFELPLRGMSSAKNPTLALACDQKTGQPGSDPPVQPPVPHRKAEKVARA